MWRPDVGARQAQDHGGNEAGESDEDGGEERLSQGPIISSSLLTCPWLHKSGVARRAAKAPPQIHAHGATVRAVADPRRLGATTRDRFVVIILRLREHCSQPGVTRTRVSQRVCGCGVPGCIVRPNA